MQKAEPVSAFYVGEANLYVEIRSHARNFPNSSRRVIPSYSEGQVQNKRLAMVTSGDSRGLTPRKTKLSVRMKVLLLAIVPLLLLATVILLASQQLERDAIAQRQSVEQSLLTSKEKELTFLLDLAFAAIEPIMQDARLSETEKQTAVKRLFNEKLFFGEDGYFYVYDLQGVNLVHPVKPDFVGKNKLDLPVVPALLQQAQRQDGVVAYRWERPSTGLYEQKIGYARVLEPWQWVVGTGLYDVGAEVETHLQQVSTRIDNTFRYMLLLLVGAIVSLVLLVFWVNWHENRLADDHLRQLVHHFVRLQIEERRGFARELHDGINQLLVAVRFRIELAQRQLVKGDASYRDSLAVALETLDTTIKEVRQVSHSLRPALLDEMGLEVALESLTKQFQERTGIRVIRYWQIIPHELSEEVAIMVYRVVQEAFSNIERHAQATQVHLEVRQAQKQLLLTLRDDGKGFDPEHLQAGRGLGLLHMRERVELLGGQFQLHSSPQQGTRITAQLPLLFMDGRK